MCKDCHMKYDVGTQIKLNDPPAHLLFLIVKSFYHGHLALQRLDIGLDKQVGLRS